ncbi:MAG: MraY family glycosyltransferase [Patescibacteria group bacterium]
MTYPIVLGISIITGGVLSVVVKYFASFLKIVDLPEHPRKLHKHPVPLLGGLALYLSFFGISFSLLYLKILPENLFRPLFWLFISGTVLMIGGFFDDKYNLPPKIQIIFPLIAVILAVYGGIRINLITNPFGGVVHLGLWISLILSFVWLSVITYTTKILDGLDGLVSGVTSLGALSIFLFSTLSDFKEGGLPYLALIAAGVFAGFLFLNAHPAKLFLGEGGSLFAGFLLGSLAIMTGAKIAVTLMVLAAPLIDLAAVIVKRVFIKKKPFFSGDRLHLHFLLVDKGWGPQYVVYIYWGLAAILGAISIFLPSIWKIISLLSISIIFFAIDIFWFKDK